MSRQLPGHPSAGEIQLADAIRFTAAQIAHMPTGSCEYFDALAFVLSRVAEADCRITSAETRRMELVLQEHASLNPAQAALVVEIARHRKRIADAGRAYCESRHLRRHLDSTESARVLGVLFEVASADGDIADCELAEILQVAAELGFTESEVTAFRRPDCGD